MAVDGDRALNMGIIEAEATEESIWSPVMGLRGAIDGSVSVRIHDGSSSASTATASTVRTSLPLELKTGKAWSSHRAQVALYSLMDADRRGSWATLPPPAVPAHRGEAALVASGSSPGSKAAALRRSRTMPAATASHGSRGAGASSAAGVAPTLGGLLVYIDRSRAHTTGVQLKWAELRSLIVQRNHLARAIAARVQWHPGRPQAALPPMLRDPHKCMRCFRFKACMLYHKSLEGGTAETSGVGAAFDAAMGHLSATHAAYLRKWDALVNAETAELLVQQSELWVHRGGDREAGSGKCCSGMVLIQVDEMPRKAPGAKLLSNCVDYLYVFERGNAVVASAAAGAGAGAGAGSAAGAAAASSALSAPVSGSVPASAPTAAASLRKLQFGPGDFVAVSAQGQGGQTACVRGYVHEVTPFRIAVKSDSKLRLPGHAEPSSGVDIEDMGGPARLSSSIGTGASGSGSVRWRIDRVEFSASVRMLRDNLVQLLAGPPVLWGDEPPSELSVVTASAQRQPPGPNRDAQWAAEDSASSIHASARAAEARAWVPGGGGGNDENARRQPVASPPPLGDVRRQQLIIDMRAPRFMKAPSSGPIMPWTVRPGAFAPTCPMPRVDEALPYANKAQLLQLRAAFESLNEDQVCVCVCGCVGYVAILPFLADVLSLPHVLLQRNAVVRALSARDYLCLQGMPGTGKTTTIAVIVRALVARGQSVLITSHTNSAVDTVLRKVSSMSGLGWAGFAWPCCCSLTLCCVGPIFVASLWRLAWMCCVLGTWRRCTWICDSTRLGLPLKAWPSAALPPSAIAWQR